MVKGRKRMRMRCKYPLVFVSNIPYIEIIHNNHHKHKHLRSIKRLNVVHTHTRAHTSSLGIFELHFLHVACDLVGVCVRKDIKI